VCVCERERDREIERAPSELQEGTVEIAQSEQQSVDREERWVESPGTVGVKQKKYLYLWSFRRKG
jgi:hypothetical protein